MHPAVIESATDSEEVNALASAVIEALDPDEFELLSLVALLLCSETLGSCIASAALKVNEHKLPVPSSLFEAAVRSAAELGEPVPDYWEDLVRQVM